MDEASNEQAGQDGDAEKGAFSQAEIDALMQGGDDPADKPAEAAPSEAAPAPAESASISQADIDALMDGGGGAADEVVNTPQQEDAASPTESGAISQGDIDALLDASNGSGAEEDAATDQGEKPAAEPDTRVDTMGRPFDEAAAAMEAAIAEERAAAQAASPTSDASASAQGGPQAQGYQLQDLGGTEAVDVDGKRVTMLNDVALRVRLQLGQTRMLVEDVLKLGEGSVVELDKLAGDPVDVLINDRLIARGEVLVLNDVFCVRICEVLSHDPHRVTT